MPRFIIFLINKETDKIISATYAENEAELTMIKRECESEENYIMSFDCSYSMRENLVVVDSDLKPKYILLSNNPAATTFAYSDEELATIVVNSALDNHISVFTCDYKMRE